MCAMWWQRERGRSGVPMLCVGVVVSSHIAVVDCLPHCRSWCWRCCRRLCSCIANVEWPLRRQQQGVQGVLQEGGPCEVA